MKVGLVDYSMGNMHSVSRAIQQANQQVCVVRSESELAQVHILVVPGVGHFDLAMKKLEQKGLRTGIAKWIAKGNPYIGICLGMHILFETSEEGKEEGLGVYKEQVKRLPVKVIPHMGWNRLECQNSEWVNWKAWPNAWAYFVHSYGVMASSQACATSTTRWFSSSSSPQRCSRWAVCSSGGRRPATMTAQQSYSVPSIFEKEDFYG